MELKEGYKKTEIGYIPSDWDIKILDNMLVEKPKYGINAPAVSFNEKLPTYVRITDISEDGYYLPDKKASVYSHFSENYVLSRGDIVLARTGASVGKSYLYNPEDGKLVYAGFLIKITTNQNLLLPSYFSHYLKTKKYWDWVKVMSVRSGQPGINGNEYGQLKIPVPDNIDEQTAIAKALSGADAWIQSLTQLIAKKRQIKQGAMQTLLNPYENGRLKDGWTLKKLGEDCELITKGATPTSFGRSFQNSGIKFIKIEAIEDSGEILKEKIAYIDNVTHKLLKRSQLKENDLLISIAGALGRISIVKKDLLPANTNQALAIVRLKRDSKLVLKFVYFFFNTKRITKFIEGVCVQGAQANLSLQNIFDLPVEYPSIDEQTLIASILTDMDNEIVDLENKLAKSILIKQGMMQNLLTGRIRLI